MTDTQIDVELEQDIEDNIRLHAPDVIIKLSEKIDRIYEEVTRQREMEADNKLNELKAASIDLSDIRKQVIQSLDVIDKKIEENHRKQFEILLLKRLDTTN